MHKCRFSAAGFALAVSMVLVLGCGSGLDLATVEGTVTMDGTPLAGAVVEFSPTAAGGSSSLGVTDASGHYELKFTADKPGALVGEHIVRISMQEAGDADETGGEAAGGDEAGLTIPDRYGADSELKETVERGANTCDFALESGATE